MRFAFPKSTRCFPVIYCLKISVLRLFHKQFCFLFFYEISHNALDVLKALCFILCSKLGVLFLSRSGGCLLCYVITSSKHRVVKGTRNKNSEDKNNIVRRSTKYNVIVSKYYLTVILMSKKIG